MNKYDYGGAKVINYGPNMTMEDAPVIQKQGIVEEVGEMTPIVFQNKLCLVRTTHVGKVFTGVLSVVDTQEILSTFGSDCEYYSAYCENDVIYAFGTRRKENCPDAIYMYVSTDGMHWQEHFLFSRPGFSFFNTSVGKGPDGYRMALEVASDNKQLRWEPSYYENDPVIGHPFTEFFLKSEDLYHWQWLPDELCYGKDRYVACPVMRWSEGYYYLICLEELPFYRYAPYIYRTKDFSTWEVGYHNPVLMYSKEDRIPKPGRKFTDAQMERFRSYFNINDCDVDLCEFEGKTHIFYMTGDQLGQGCMCQAIYDGPINEFFKAFVK